MLATIKQYLKNTVFLAIVALVCIVLIQHNKVLSLKEDLKVLEIYEDCMRLEDDFLILIVSNEVEEDEFMESIREWGFAERGSKWCIEGRDEAFEFIFNKFLLVVNV